MATNGTYLRLVTSEFRNATKFNSTLDADVSPSVTIQNVLESLIPKFDLDNAVGDQLDIIGEWVGALRNVPFPITDVYFEWENAALGWELGSWKGPFDPDTGPVLLPDDVYRTLIKSKIAANRWNGSIPQAYEIYSTLFSLGGIVIQDNGNMTMNYGFFGAPPSAFAQALLQGGVLTLKPEGVRINEIIVVTDFAPLFAWDIEDLSSIAVQGWDIGYWGKELYT